jgi:transcriptional regulator with XRE-family HTH domain
MEAGETPHLETLGARLAAVRRDRGLTQDTLAEAAELSTSGIHRIEAGTRRTRRSTLDRIAAALGDPELAAELAGLAGPALAPESLYGEPIARRRARRHVRRRARGEWAARRAKERELDDLLRELDRLARRHPAYTSWGG